MANFMWIIIGGGVGSGVRYGSQTLVDRWLGGGFPYGILVVNVLGCLLIGVLGQVFKDAVGLRETCRLALIVGFLGGFTTFSSFGYDTLKLFLDDQVAKAMINVVASNVLGLAAVWAGYRAAEQWARA